MHYCLAIEYWIQVEELCRGKTRKDCLIVNMQLHKIININNIINIIITSAYYIKFMVNIKSNNKK